MLKSVAIALALSAAQQPPAPTCIPRQGVSDLAILVSPFLIDATIDTCKAHLPATAFLSTGAAGFSARLKADGVGREQSAMQTLQMFAGDKIPQVKDQRAFLQVSGEIIATTMMKDLTPARCREASDLIESLAALPSQHFGSLIVSILGLTKPWQTKAGKMKGPGMCERE